MTNEPTMIPPTVDSVPGAFQAPVFPSMVDDFYTYPHEPDIKRYTKRLQPGLTILDFFAAQYMAAGKLPDEAFRLARIAMKERDSHG